MTSERQPQKALDHRIAMVDNENGVQDEPGESTPLVDTDTLVGTDDTNDEEDDDNQDGTTSWAGHDDFVGLPWWRRPSVYWLVAPYFLFALAFGGSIVPKLNLIVDLVCRQYYADQKLADPTLIFTPIVLGSDNPQCSADAVQKLVAGFTLVISVMTGLLSAVTAPKLGSLSDRYGRKVLLTVASFGGVVNEVITILAARFPDAVDYRWLILGAFFDGLTGSMVAGSLLAHTYVSDCSPPVKRAVNIGYLYACLFTGLAFGPILAGYFVKWTGSLLSIFYVTLGCHLFFILFVLLVAPESLSKKRQMLARKKHEEDVEATATHLQRNLPDFLANLLGPRVASFVNDRLGTWLPAILSANPLAPLRILFPRGRENRALARNLIILALVDTIIMGTQIAFGTIIILYSQKVFHWGVLEQSKFISIVSLVRVVIIMAIFPGMNYFFRTRPQRRRRQEGGVGYVDKSNTGADSLDIWTLRIALASDVLGIVGYILAGSGEVFVFCGVLTAFGGLGSSTIQSAMSKHVPSERVGSLLGAMGLLHSLSRVIAPFIFNGVYYATVDHFPQADFVLLASIFGTALLACFFLRPHLFMKEDGYTRIPVRDADPPINGSVLAEEEMPSETLPRI